MAEPADTSVVIPAFNEADGIAAVVEGIRQNGPWLEILVIDDGSTDDTGTLARAAGARVVRQPYNKGLGAAIKRGIRIAAGAHVLIMDGDGQHRPEDARRLVSCLGEYDLVVGARPSATQATAGRRLGNALLNELASRLTAHPVADLTSGFRAARTELLREFVHMLPNGFSSAATITLAAIKAGYSVTFQPTAARPRQGSSKIRFARDGFKFWLILLRVVTIYSPLRIFVPISLLLLAGGLGYSLWTIITETNVTDSAAMLIMLSVLVFLIGLVSDQIATLRMDARGRDRR
jgi:glycosyltransferase involved in cell wall biosynthesis